MMKINLVNRLLVLPLAIAAITLGSANADQVRTTTVDLHGGNDTVLTWETPIYPSLRVSPVWTTHTYKVYVWIAPTSTATNAVYRVYPKGPGSDCSATDPNTPCFEIPINATQHLGEWVQLMLTGDPATKWEFMDVFGQVKLSAKDFGTSEV